MEEDRLGNPMASNWILSKVLNHQESQSPGKMIETIVSMLVDRL